MIVVWTPEAEQDRADIWDYIAADNLDAAVRMDVLFSNAATTLAATQAIVIRTPDMTATVKLATARELAQTGSVRRASLLGQHGGYAIVLRVGTSDRVLATKSGAPRLFAQLDRAARLLRDELGIARFAVDAADYAPGDMVRRPDRAAALPQQAEDAAYTTFLRERTEAAAAQADAHPDTILSNADAGARMKAHTAALQARLDRAVETRR